MACTTGEDVVNKDIGSISSRLGVCLGVCFGVLFGDVSLLPAEENQNRFLFIGLPELAKKLVESDADRGLFGKLSFPASSTPIAVFGVGLTASAVFGLCTGLSSSRLAGVVRAAGLLIDVTLPVNE